MFDGIWLEYQQSNNISFKIKQLANSVLRHVCNNVQDIIRSTIQLFAGTINQHLGI